MGEIEGSGENAIEALRLEVANRTNEYDAAEAKIKDLHDGIDFATALQYGFGFIATDRRLSQELIKLLTIEGCEMEEEEIQNERDKFRELKLIELFARQGLYVPARRYFQRLSRVNSALASTYHEYGEVKEYVMLAFGFNALANAFPERGAPLDPRLIADQ